MKLLLVAFALTLLASCGKPDIIDPNDPSKTFQVTGRHSDIKGTVVDAKDLERLKLAVQLTLTTLEP